MIGTDEVPLTLFPLQCGWEPKIDEIYSLYDNLELDFPILTVLQPVTGLDVWIC
jgi:hypothetical protein